VLRADDQRRASVPRLGAMEGSLAAASEPSRSA